MKCRSRQILAATAVIILLAWSARRAWRIHSATPALASVVTAVSVVPTAGTAARRDGSGEGVSARSAEAAPMTDSSAARFRRQIAEMAAEFDRLRALPDDIEDFRASAELENEYAALLEETPALASMLVREMPPGFVDSHFGVLALIRWAASERAVAAAWMAANPAATPSAAQALARGWLGEDEAALMQYLAALPPGPWRSNLAYNASEDAFVAKRPETVLKLLEKTAPADPRHTQLVEWNATAWAMQDTAAAAAWAAAYPEASRRQTLLAAVAIGEANRDPAAAAHRLAMTVADPTRRREATRSIARIWTARDPAAAARWAAELPETTLRDAAEEGLMAIAAP